MVARASAAFAGEAPAPAVRRRSSRTIAEQRRALVVRGTERGEDLRDAAGDAARAARTRSPTRSRRRPSARRRAERAGRGRAVARASATATARARVFDAAAPARPAPPAAARRARDSALRGVERRLSPRLTVATSDARSSPPLASRGSRRPSSWPADTRVANRGKPVGTRSVHRPGAETIASPPVTGSMAAGTRIDARTSPSRTQRSGKRIRPLLLLQVRDGGRDPSPAVSRRPPRPTARRRTRSSRRDRAGRKALARRRRAPIDSGRPAAACLPRETRRGAAPPIPATRRPRPPASGVISIDGRPALSALEIGEPRQVHGEPDRVCPRQAAGTP